MKYRIGSLLFLALAAFALPAQSQSIDWKLEEFQPDIPFGGRADTIAVNPSDNRIMFVASEFWWSLQDYRRRNALESY